MVIFRLLLLSPPLLLIFSPFVKSLDSTHSSPSQEWNDTLMEGSGEGSGLSLSLNDEVSSTLTVDESRRETLSQSDIGSPRTRPVSLIDKRATDPTNHRLGSLPIDLIGKMDLRSSSAIPPSSLMAMGRPLRKGRASTQTEYVVLLVQSSTRRWGRLFIDPSHTTQAQFVDGTRVVDARDSSLPFRVILLPSDAASTYNVDVQWVQARLVDPLSIVVQVDTRGSYSKVTAGVFVNSDYEYLGEADIENRRFTYIDNGHVAIVEGPRFDSSVYVLTKTTCSCSCQSKGSSSLLANIKDFFG